MNPIIDTIILVLFVLFLIYLVAGFNRQQIKKHNDKMDMLDKRQKEFEDKNK
jgi:p-aminobenzoyl-glutamate transporter AbgT